MEFFLISEGSLAVPANVNAMQRELDKFGMYFGNKTQVRHGGKLNVREKNRNELKKRILS